MKFAHKMKTYFFASIFMFGTTVLANEAPTEESIQNVIVLRHSSWGNEYGMLYFNLETAIEQKVLQPLFIASFITFPTMMQAAEAAGEQPTPAEIVRTLLEIALPQLENAQIPAHLWEEFAAFVKMHMEMKRARNLQRYADRLATKYTASAAA